MMLMGLPEIFSIISAVLDFPKTILEFVKMLRKTPQDKHDEILKKMAEEAKKFEQEGRPTW